MDTPHPPPPPPPPPTHTTNTNSDTYNKAFDLPPGNYDIFIIPPHSSGSRFLYLPSLQPQWNSFVAGCVCTLFICGVYAVLVGPLVRWAWDVLERGGVGVVVGVVVGMGAWVWGRRESERTGAGSGAREQTSPSNPGKARTANATTHPSPGGRHTASQPPPPRPSSTKTTTSSQPPTQSPWEKAREETRRRKEQEARQSSPSTTSFSNTNSKAEAEKARWEQARAREREAREKEARERVAKDRAERERAKAAGGEARGTPRGDGTSSRPRPATVHTVYTESTNSSAYGSTLGSETSHTQSHSTAPTSIHPSSSASHSSTSTSVPADALFLHSVHLLPTASTTPDTSLLASKSDNLLLRINSEGFFVDDLQLNEGLREWDVKAWGIRSIERGEYVLNKNEGGMSLQVLRVTMREAGVGKYVFVVIDEEDRKGKESKKVDEGLSRLKGGRLGKGVVVSGMKEGEVVRVLNGIGVVL